MRPVRPTPEFSFLHPRHTALRPWLTAGLIALSALIVGVGTASAAPFDVTNTSNSGTGSLRKAIQDSNATPGTNQITFHIAGSGPYKIQLATPLDPVSVPVVIDATTQSGFAVAPIVELSGPNTVGSIGLEIQAGNSTVRGLIINTFERGISLNTNGSNTIVGNYIGTGPTGNTATPNMNYGIEVNNVGNNMIGGITPADRNVISGNNGSGIFITGVSGGGAATLNTIRGNYIGIGANGSTAVRNFLHGISITQEASNNTIGGLTAAAGNVISGNLQNGILVAGGANHTTISGNFIGTNSAGTGAVGNQNNGVSLSSPDNLVGGTSGITPAGPCSGACNVISGNFAAGINMSSAGGLSVTSGNTIQGNYVGLDISGANALPNKNSGVFLSNATNNTIGGTTVNARNVISGNSGGTGFTAPGIRLNNSGTTGNQIFGNYIGTGIDGVTNKGNEISGVLVDEGASNNQIGGTGAGAGNVIAFNGGAFQQSGVSIRDAGTGNAVRGNSIFSNQGLGIDLNGNGSVDLNDFKDPDTGPNNLQNYPVISNAFTGATSISGTLNSTPGLVFQIDIFSNPACDTVNGNGEGQTYLGSGATTLTDTDGNASFNIATPALTAAQFITGTATDPNGNTSEFSVCKQVTNPLTPIATPTATTTPTPTLTRTLTSSPTSTVTRTPTITNTSAVTATSTRTLTSTATVTPQPGLNGRITLPGRPAPSTINQVRVLVTFYSPPGTGNVSMTATPTTDTSGNFNVSTVPPGAYDVEVKYPLSLSRKAQAVVIVTGQSTFKDFTILRAGDADNNNQVDILDFSVLRKQFGTAATCASTSIAVVPCADFDASSFVDIVDFSLLRSNFGGIGPDPA